MYVALNPHSRHLTLSHSLAHLRLFTKPPAGTMLQLCQRTFTHNMAVVVPIIVARSIKDSINDLVGCEAFLGWVVWGRGREGRTYAIMQIMHTVCLKCTCHSVPTHFTSHHNPILHGTAADDTQRPAPIRAPCPICVSTSSLDSTLDNTAAPVRNPFPFVHEPNTIDGDRIVVPAGCRLGRLGPDRGVVRRQVEYTRQRPHCCAAG